MSFNKTDFAFRPCQGEGSWKLIPKKKINLDLQKIKLQIDKKVQVEFLTGFLIVFNFESYKFNLQKNGTLLIKEINDKLLAEKLLEKAMKIVLEK